MEVNPNQHSLTSRAEFSTSPSNFTRSPDSPYSFHNYRDTLTCEKNIPQHVCTDLDVQSGDTWSLGEDEYSGMSGIDNSLRSNHRHNVNGTVSRTSDFGRGNPNDSNVTHIPNLRGGSLADELDEVFGVWGGCDDQASDEAYGCEDDFIMEDSVTPEIAKLASSPHKSTSLNARNPEISHQFGRHPIVSTHGDLKGTRPSLIIPDSVYDISHDKLVNGINALHLERPADAPLKFSESSPEYRRDMARWSTPRYDGSEYGSTSDSETSSCFHISRDLELVMQEVESLAQCGLNLPKDPVEKFNENPTHQVNRPDMDLSASIPTAMSPSDGQSSMSILSPDSNTTSTSPFTSGRDEMSYLDTVIPRVIELLQQNIPSQSNVESSVSRLIATHTALTSHIAYQTRSLASLSSSILSPVAPPIPPELASELINLITRTLEELPRSGAISSSSGRSVSRTGNRNHATGLTPSSPSMSPLPQTCKTHRRSPRSTPSPTGGIGSAMSNYTRPTVNQAAAICEPTGIPNHTSRDSGVPPVPQSALVSLHHLSISTSNLLSHLSQLSDSLHMNHQTHLAASRRLASTRALVKTLRSDLSKLEEAERYIEHGQWDQKLRERWISRECGGVVTGFANLCGDTVLKMNIV